MGSSLQPEAAAELNRPKVERGGPPSLFDPGRNCCSVATAGRVAFLIDGEAYFRAFMRAAERATHSIVVLAWDFNSSAHLHFDEAAKGDAPSRVGEFLNWLVRRRRGLDVYVLDWDYPLVFGADRELPHRFGLGWKPHRRVHIAYDNTHPVSGSHHQKIVVIDGAMAFIGGLDLTEKRWDTPSHRPDDPRRTCADAPYPPFHDLMMAVDGDAARALLDIARARWHAATRHELPPVPALAGDPWPPGLRCDLTDVEVAFARTLPESTTRPGIHEVQALYLDMIAAAKQRIYVENQYFTAYGIGEALEKRLAEPDGPEIVVVVRLFSHGWLEEHTMHVLRTRLIQRLRAADRYGRFHVYYPHVDGLPEKICIDLHSKLMIVDDEILRIGSANLCNRSMGFDSECDGAIEARGNPRVARAIRGLRNRLLAEHLDATPQDVDHAVQTHGTLHGAIAELAGKCRTLKPIEQLPDWPEAVIELASVGDPSKPVLVDALVEDFSPELALAPCDSGPVERKAGRLAFIRRVAVKVGLFFLVVGALTAIWRYTPLAQWIDGDRATAWAREFANRWWAPLVIVAAYTPACVVMFPRPLITLAAVVAFGPYLGFVYAMTGVMLASYLSYVAGLKLPPHRVHAMSGPGLRRVLDALRQRGLLAITAVRLVPLAPFAVEGFVAAAIRIKLWHFMLGTFLGMAPGVMTTTIFGDQLQAALEDPAKINYALLATAVLAVTALTLGVRRWLVNQQRQYATHGDADHRTR